MGLRGGHCSELVLRAAGRPGGLDGQTWRVSGSASGRLRVFVSCSRDNHASADQLLIAIVGSGFDALSDRHGVSGAE